MEDVDEEEFYFIFLIFVSVFSLFPLPTQFRRSSQSIVRGIPNPQHVKYPKFHRIKADGCEALYFATVHMTTYGLNKMG